MPGIPPIPGMPMLMPMPGNQPLRGTVGRMVGNLAGWPAALLPVSGLVSSVLVAAEEAAPSSGWTYRGMYFSRAAYFAANVVFAEMTSVMPSLKIFSSSRTAGS